MGQMRIKPKLDELKRKYGDDKQRYSQEMQKLYQEENISMSGGCLPMIIRTVIMFSIYYLITKPITYLMHVPVDTIGAIAEKLSVTSSGYDRELLVIEALTKNPSVNPEIAAKAANFNFSLFGIDLTQKPEFNINIFEGFNSLWLIPIMAFAAQMLTSVISLKMQKRLNPDAPSMSGMMLTMPVISLFIGFTLPAGVGFYWICSSLIAGGIQTAVQYFYGPNKMLARERAKEILAVYDEEQKFISKRVVEDDSVSK